MVRVVAGAARSRRVGAGRVRALVRPDLVQPARAVRPRQAALVANWPHGRLVKELGAKDRGAKELGAKARYAAGR